MKERERGWLRDREIGEQEERDRKGGKKKGTKKETEREEGRREKKIQGHNVNFQEHPRIALRLGIAR